MNDLENKIDNGFDSLSKTDKIIVRTAQGLGIAFLFSLGVYAMCLNPYKNSVPPKHESWSDMYNKADTNISIQVLDFDHDGFIDWKTVYKWKYGELIGIETTAKESWYNKFGIQERRHLANIVPDSTKITYDTTKVE